MGGVLKLKRDKWKTRIDYRLEVLPDDFIVFKSIENMGFKRRQSGGIKAKDAITNCCESRPLKYYPYPDAHPETWWLICAGCNGAIKANGDAL